MDYIANFFGYILNFLYDFVQNYGLAIILFSVLLKLLMLPLAIRQQKSMKKSQELQGELKKLQIKYKNNQELLQQETMALYKREKISPFSGCLGTILQLVIFLSVFYLVSRPLTYMKKIDSQVISDYEQQISQNQENKSNYKEIQIIELYSDKDDRVNLNMNFLGLDLSKVPTQNWEDFRVFIIPLLYVITTFVNIKITTSMTNKKKEEEKKKDTDSDNDKEESIEDQLEGMQGMTKSMSYMMPIMSIAIAMIAPLGLSLYWLISNSLQLIERIAIDKFSKNSKEKETKLLEGKK
ncbi:MAG: YidC/Oxa1 family membrane protein insertase [Clostridia bacterium]|nr:YidC/Oxa1 family membrane protein insertase [Clostridia bacterium]